MASGQDATVLGRRASGNLQGATAVGFEAAASEVATTVVGYQAQAGANSAVAVGRGATANHQNSVAIGRDATTTAANQVTLGGTGSAVRIGDIAASTQAQVGPVSVVTVDEAGTLGRQTVATAASVDNVRVSMNTMQAITDAQIQNLSGSISALDGRITGLAFQLEDLDQRTRGGIAAAMAMGGTMIVPDSTFSVSANVSTYQGEQGFSGSIAARVRERVYITASVAGSTAEKSTGGRVGVAFGF